MVFLCLVHLAFCEFVFCLVKTRFMLQRLVLQVVKMAVCVSHVMSVNVHQSTWVSDVSIHCAEHRALMAVSVFDLTCACVLLHGKEITVKNLCVICLV